MELRAAGGGSEPVVGRRPSLALRRDCRALEGLRDDDLRSSGVAPRAFVGLRARVGFGDVRVGVDSALRSE